MNNFLNFRISSTKKDFTKHNVRDSKTKVSLDQDTKKMKDTSVKRTAKLGSQ